MVYSIYGWEVGWWQGWRFGEHLHSEKQELWPVKVASGLCLEGTIDSEWGFREGVPKCKDPEVYG